MEQEADAGDADFLEPLGALRRPLEALGELLQDAGEEHRLMIVGGVAILLHRIRARTTYDVDVIARVELDRFEHMRLVPPDPLPPALAEAVTRVGVTSVYLPDGSMQLSVSNGAEAMG